MNVRNFISSLKFNIKSHSPEILIGAGIAGTVIGTVFACVATIKVKDEVDEFKNKIEEIHIFEKENKETLNDADEQEIKKELTRQYVKLGLNVIKFYAPALIIEGLSIVSIFGSNKILRTRSATAIAAYSTIASAFKKYRKAVADRFGDEVEKEIRYGITTEVEDSTVVDESTGKKKKVKKETKIVNGNTIKDHSPFAMIFDETNPNWSKDYVGRKFFLEKVRNYCNDRLRANGYLFLNDVYKDLGFPETKAGQVFGWLYRPDDKDYHGDGFVDFGIYDLGDKIKVDFVNGYEEGIILDFNVDGDILNFKNTEEDAKTIMSPFTPYR